MIGVNTALVVAQRSNPAEPSVALLADSSFVAARTGSVLPLLPHTFMGPGDVGPAARFLAEK